MIVQTSSFWEVNFGHVIDAGLLIVAWMGYRISRRSDIREAQTKRAEEANVQMKMHTQNQERLKVLMEFHENQNDINNKRDEQISLLREQTASFKHMAEGLDRRLQLMENKYGRIR